MQKKIFEEWNKGKSFSFSCHVGDGLASYLMKINSGG
jgi:hypothetical protein